MELTRDMIRIDGDFSLNDEGTVVTAYIETWFDVEKKFGVNLNDDLDAGLNFYANYNVETDELTCEYIVSKANSCVAYNYQPTAAETKLIAEMMQEACQDMHGCDLLDYANPMTMNM
jgi:hypothetical protein